MREAAVPLALTVVVCLPSTFMMAWLLARSSLGRSLGMPAADGLSPMAYARVLLGFRTGGASEDDWDRFSELLSQAALGRVGPWDRLGPEEPPRLQPSSGRTAPQAAHPATRFLSRRGSLPQPGGRIVPSGPGWDVGGVRVTPLRIVLVVLAVFMVTALVRPGAPAAAASAMPEASALRLPVAWQQHGSGAVSAVISPQSAPLLSRSLSEHGYDRGCARLGPDSSQATSRPGTVDEANARGPWMVLCSAGNGTFRVVVNDGPEGFVVVLSRA